MAHTPHRRVILDMDSSESPVHGEQESAAYNGHFGCVCYHQIFVFNQFGDCEGAMLRPGNVHRAHDWRKVLDPILACYERTGVRRYFRADAAFAKPEVYEYLEEQRVQAVIDTPGRVTLLLRQRLIVLQDTVDHSIVRVEPRPTRWLFPPVPGRHRILQHLADRIAVQIEHSGCLTDAHPF